MKKALTSFLKPLLKSIDMIFLTLLIVSFLLLDINDGSPSSEVKEKCDRIKDPINSVSPDHFRRYKNIDDPFPTKYPLQG